MKGQTHRDSISIQLTGISGFDPLTGAPSAYLPSEHSLILRHLKVGVSSSQFLEVRSASGLELALLTAVLLDSWVHLALSPSLIVLFTSGCEGWVGGGWFTSPWLSLLHPAQVGLWENTSFPI